jgi:hypothetical protein
MLVNRVVEFRICQVKFAREKYSFQFSTSAAPEAAATVAEAQSLENFEREKIYSGIPSSIKLYEIK